VIWLKEGTTTYIKALLWKQGHTLTQTTAQHAASNGLTAPIRLSGLSFWRL